MLNTFTSSTIVGKARGIYGKRIKTVQYNTLLRQYSVSDIANYLKTNTSYSEDISSLSDINLHRGQLETLLKNSYYKKYFSLCNYDFSKNHGFYNYFIIDFEVNLILKAIGLLNSSSMENLLLSLPLYLDKYTSFNLIEITKIKSFSDLLLVLKNTPYVDIIKDFNSSNGNINLFDCEKALVIFYYQTILKLANKYYNKKTTKELQNIVLMEVELLNINSIYRLKYNFNRDNKDIKDKLLPFVYKMNNKKLVEFLNTQTPNEFINRINISRLGYKFQNNDFQYIEDYTKRLRFMIYKKLIHFTSSAPVCVFALIALMKIEVENLIMIIEGVRYNKDAELIKNLLILE